MLNYSPGSPPNTIAFGIRAFNSSRLSVNTRTGILDDSWMAIAAASVIILV
jgi:hypothetical protein